MWKDSALTLFMLLFTVFLLNTWLSNGKWDQGVEHRMPGIILAVLNLPPLIQIVPVKGTRKIGIVVQHQPEKGHKEMAS